MRFSIIVPVYNGENTIRRCLNSIISQLYTDFECLVINDGSDDDTSKILELEYSSYSNIKIINKKNEGVSSARNVGIDQAQGEYIVFIDSDDYVEKDFLFQFAQSNSDIIICGFKAFGAGFDEHIPSRYKTKEQIAILNYIDQNFNEMFIRAPWCKAFKNSLFKIKSNIRFNENLTSCEDICLNLILYSLSSSLEILPVKTYNYFAVSYSKYYINSKQALMLSKALKQSLSFIPQDYSKNINLYLSKYVFNSIRGYIWNSSINEGIVNAFLFYKYKLYNDYLPFYGFVKIRKGCSLIYIPIKKLIKKSL